MKLAPQQGEVPAQPRTKEMRSRWLVFLRSGKCEGNLLAFFLFFCSTLEVRPLYTYALSAVMIIPKESRSSFVLWRIFLSFFGGRNCETMTSANHVEILYG